MWVRVCVWGVCVGTCACVFYVFCCVVNMFDGYLCVLCFCVFVVCV